MMRILNTSGEPLVSIRVKSEKQMKEVIKLLEPDEVEMRDK